MKKKITSFLSLYKIIEQVLDTFDKIMTQKKQYKIYANNIKHIVIVLYVGNDGFHVDHDMSIDVNHVLWLYVRPWSIQIWVCTVWISQPRKSLRKVHWASNTDVTYIWEIFCLISPPKLYFITIRIASLVLYYIKHVNIMLILYLCFINQHLYNRLKQNSYYSLKKLSNN